MRRPIRTAATIEEKASSSRTMSAASRATSVPRSPMAIPMWAALSAGASLTPSPVIATTSPSARSAAYEPQLLLRDDPREDVCRPQPLAERGLLDAVQLLAGDDLRRRSPTSRAMWRAVPG